MLNACWGNRAFGGNSGFLELRTPVAQAWPYPAVGSMLPWLRAVRGKSVGTRVGLESDLKGLTGLWEPRRQGMPEMWGDTPVNPPYWASSFMQVPFPRTSTADWMTTHPLLGHSEET